MLSAQQQEFLHSLLARARSRGGFSNNVPRPITPEIRSGSGADERDPALLGNSINRMVINKGWDLQVAAGRLKGMWPQIVGESVAQHVSIEAFELDSTGMSGTLILRASSTAWASQIRLLQTTIREKLDEEMGLGRIGEIVINGPSAPTWKHGYRSVKGRGPRDTYG